MGPFCASSMSGAHVTGEQLDRLRDGSLSAAGMAVVGGHVATCDPCRKVVGEVVPLERMTRDLRVQIEADQESRHLSDEELMAHADGTLRNDAHLQECATCRDELDELLRFKSRMRPRRKWLPYAVAASIAAIVLSISLFDRAPDPAVPSPAGSTVVTPAPPAPVAVNKGYGRPEWDAWVSEAKERRLLPVPAIYAELQRQKSQLRGGSEEDDLRLSPDQVVVLSAQPRFQWAGRAGASYNVILRNGDVIVESGTLTAPRWRPPQLLQRGREYLWQVEVAVDGAHSLYPKPPQPPARFRVLEQSAVDGIEDARDRYPEDDLLQAVVLSRHGLRSEALAAVERLKRSDAALAADLRASLGDWPAGNVSR